MTGWPRFRWSDEAGHFQLNNPSSRRVICKHSAMICMSDKHGTLRVLDNARS
ncbi:hypothetical protein Mal52_37110 [Symmachiella dynata]|uniref:Uncharacterized protein n=1 Tax=Symmachiella dynata TaxID=2527995 RepID=A0A517ZRW2_9PLAN|nr:hypothetical protein Mal52_37110 [Symmachiella dynata]